MGRADAHGTPGGAGPSDARHRVLVLGAGFGGLDAAAGFAGEDVDVTVVDRNNFHTFQPLLYQVATAGLNAADVAYPVRAIVSRQGNVRFRRAEVTGIDFDRRCLRLAGGELAYDHLVIALGASTNFFGVPGAAEHGFPLYVLPDAVRLRNHILSRFEAAAADPALVDDGALAVTVVGGGATGVEVAGALVELFDRVLRKDFAELDLSRATVTLLEARDELLAPFRPGSRRHALEELRRRGVDVRLGCTVQSVDRTRVCLASGEVVLSHTLVWAAGVRASPVVAALGLATGPGGRVDVNPDLRVPGHPEVFAVGDVALVRDAPSGRVLAQVAPVAMQSGRHAARQIRRLRAGLPTEGFRYLDKGTMATIGRRAAVADLPMRVNLYGTPGWLAWLGLHLVFLVGFRNRLSVLLNWFWNYLTWDRGPRLILHTEGPDAPAEPGDPPEAGGSGEPIERDRSTERRAGRSAAS